DVDDQEQRHRVVRGARGRVVGLPRRADARAVHADGAFGGAILMMKSKWICVAFLAGCAHAPPPAPAPSAPVPAPAPAPPAEAEPHDELSVSGTLGTLADEEVSGPFQRRWDDITNCYQQAQAKLWYLGGKIEVHVKVGKSGEPKTAYVSSSTFGNWE